MLLEVSSVKVAGRENKSAREGRRGVFLKQDGDAESGGRRVRSLSHSLAHSIQVQSSFGSCLQQDGSPLQTFSVQQWSTFRHEI